MKRYVYPVWSEINELGEDAFSRLQKKNRRDLLDTRRRGRWCIRRVTRRGERYVVEYAIRNSRGEPHIAYTTDVPTLPTRLSKIELDRWYQSGSWG